MPPALVGRAATMQMGPSQPKIARFLGSQKPRCHDGFDLSTPWRNKGFSMFFISGLFFSGFTNSKPWLFLRAVMLGGEKKGWPSSAKTPRDDGRPGIDRGDRLVGFIIPPFPEGEFPWHGTRGEFFCPLDILRYPMEKNHQKSEGWKSSLLRNSVFLLGKKVVTKTFFLEVKMSNTWGEKYIIPNSWGFYLCCNVSWWIWILLLCV